MLIVQITLVLFEERREGKMRRRLSVLTLGFLCLLVLAMSLLEAYAGVFIIPDGVPHVPASVDVEPDTLNMASNGNWIYCLH